MHAGDVGLVGNRVVGIELHQIIVGTVHLAAGSGKPAYGKRPGQVLVQVGVVLVVGVPALDGETLDGSEREGERLGVGETLALVHGLLDGNVRVVEGAPLSVIVQVVHLGIDAQHRRNVNGPGPHGRTANGGLVVVIEPVQDVGAIVHLEPLVETMAQVQAANHALGTGIQDNTLVVRIGNGCEIIGFLAVATN